MPNIKTYESGVAAPRADSAGSEAYEIEGRHIEGAYAEAGQAIGQGITRAGDAVNTHYEIQDSSQISAQGAQAFADLSKSLATTMANADPNKADEAADGWRSQMEDAISKVGGDAITKQGQEQALRTQNTLRDEFTRQSMAYQSSLSGTAIINNLQQTKDGLAAAVKLNPSLLPGALTMLNGSMQDQIRAHSFLSADEVSRVQGEFQAKASRDLGLAAFETMAQNNPAAAKAALTSPTFAGIFGGEDINTLSRYADAQAKAQIEAKTAQDNLVNKQNEEAFKQTTSGILGTMIQPNGALLVPRDAPQKIIAASLMPGADAGEIRSMIEMTRTINKDNTAGAKAITDPGTYETFSKRMIDGGLDDKDVYQARADGLLSDKDTSYFLRGQKDLAADPNKKVAEKQFNDWVSAQKPAFTTSGLLGLKDPVGSQKYNQFMQAAHEKFEQTYSSQGNWQDLLNAKSGDYLGKMAPAYMTNIKGANTSPVPHWTSAADADKGYAALPKGAQYYGPDGLLRTK